MKILLGVITSDRNEYCLSMFNRTLKNLDCGEHKVDVLIVDNSEGPEYAEKVRALGYYVIKNRWYKYVRDRITTSRNILRSTVICNSYDYLFTVDSDIFLRRSELLRLLSYEKKVVLAPYSIMKNCPEPKEVLCVQMLLPDGKPCFYTPAMIGHPELIMIHAGGIGCSLIHREVLEKIEFRNDPQGSTTKEDLFFCEDARNAGYGIWCDFSLQISHQNAGWADIILKEG